MLGCIHLLCDFVLYNILTVRMNTGVRRKHSHDIQILYYLSEIECNRHIHHLLFHVK